MTVDVWGIVKISLITFGFIVLIICVMVLFSNLLLCIQSITKYFNRKADLFSVKILKKQEVDFSKSAKDATAILSLLDTMILNEVKALLKTYISLNESYPITKMQEDIEKISKNVFGSIRKESFSSLRFLDDEYLMKYITESSSYNLITSVMALNTGVRS